MSYSTHSALAGLDCTSLFTLSTSGPESKLAHSRFRKRERGSSHAKAFRQWLVRTVGLCRLCAGSGVLDVAGGKVRTSFLFPPPQSTRAEKREQGEGMVLKRVLNILNFQGQLSFELLNLKAVPTTVVDPRQERLKKILLCSITCAFCQCAGSLLNSICHLCRPLNVAKYRESFRMGHYGQDIQSDLFPQTMPQHKSAALLTLHMLSGGSPKAPRPAPHGISSASGSPLCGRQALSFLLLPLLLRLCAQLLLYCLV